MGLRSFLSFLFRRSVGEDDDAGVEGVCAHEFQDRLLDAFPERPPPAPQHHGEDHEPVLVDEVVLHQGVNEFAAAEDEDILAVSLL
jgi:hypothetical protein